MKTIDSTKQAEEKFDELSFEELFGFKKEEKNRSSYLTSKLFPFQRESKKS